MRSPWQGARGRRWKGRFSDVGADRDVDVGELAADMREMLGAASGRVREAAESAEVRQRLTELYRHVPRDRVADLYERIPADRVSVSGLHERVPYQEFYDRLPREEVVALGAAARRATAEIPHKVGEAGERVPTLRLGRKIAVARFAARGVAAVLGWAIVYRTWIRPAIYRWGARDAEVQVALPGDDIVESPRMQTTRAVTIGAPPADVWPWLVQMGQGRGGLYTYDWLENLLGCDIESIDHVDPELQDLSVGDSIRLVREDYPVDLHLEVAALEPDRHLVLRTPGSREENLAQGFPYATWAFVLAPEASGRTRLIVRWRSDYADGRLNRFWSGWGMELPHFLMERKMLWGLRRRAEGRIG